MLINHRILLKFLAFCCGVIVVPAIASGQKVTVFAAASLKNVLDEISARWLAETGMTAIAVYAGSATLAKQIEAGAPADIFIPADTDWMDYLRSRQLMAPETEVKLLGNRLVLIVPAGNAAAVSIVPGFDLAGLLGGGKLAMGDVKAAPAGKYARAALESLGLWHKVAGNVVQSENVRAALRLVATGEAAAGIVYATDALAEPQVRVAGVFPANSHPAIVYPAALTSASQNPGAGAFLAFLLSGTAQEIFEKQGFTVLAGRK